MTQPPQPADMPGGHPEPEPVPSPEPGPPQPIPAPEPPHVEDATAVLARVDAAAEDPTDFIDGGPPSAPLEFPPVGAYPGEPGHPATTGEPTQVLQVMPGRSPAVPAHDAAVAAQAWYQPPPAEIRRQEPIWSGGQLPPWQVPLATAPRKRRAGLWVSLALAAVLVLCGGGAVSAYFLVSNADNGKGAPDPATAVNRFMAAIYNQQDAAAAGQLVCRQARDEKKLTARVNEIKSYASEYEGPTFRWTEPTVNGETDERAVVSVQLTLSTQDEKTAKQSLTFTTVHKAGWLVCEISG
jgi:flagellar basal body-associated protein FliL